MRYLYCSSISLPICPGRPSIACLQEKPQGVEGAAGELDPPGGVPKVCPLALGDRQLPGSPVVLLHPSHLVGNINKERLVSLESSCPTPQGAWGRCQAGDGDFGGESWEGRDGNILPTVDAEGSLWGGWFGEPS